MTVTGEPTGLDQRKRASGRAARRSDAVLDLRGPDPVIDFAPSLSAVGARARRERRFGSSLLRVALVTLDVLAFLAAWALALVVMSNADRSIGSSLALVAGIAVGGVLLHVNQGLYLARVNSVRTDELARILRSTVLLTLGAQVVTTLADVPLTVFEALAGGVLTLLFLLTARGGFRVWIGAQRARGRFVRPIVIVGANDEARELVDIVRTHPETGLIVTAVFGDQAEADEQGLGSLYGGTVDEAVLAVDAAEITGAIVAVSALESATLNRVARELAATGTHLHLTSGLRGISSQRLQSHSIAHEPVMYVEPLRLAWWQGATKRLLDIVGAGLILVPTAPLIGICALIVKLQDGGPAFFRQARVGRHGEIFQVLKIRTMVVDAEQRLEELQEDNERSGPLFKVDRDPRFTRFGRFMDITSINELPQLWNVMRGEMSLVGPRPALPSEAKEFDEELQARFMVRPGITGLWQVEARDNPSFEAYRRLDLHYVENWSVTFDLVILLSTVEVVVSRFVGGLGARRRRHARAELTDSADLAA